MLVFYLLLDTDSEWIEDTLRLVKSMSMFIRRAPAAIFSFTFLTTLFTSAATAHRTFMTLFIPFEKVIYLRITPFFFRYFCLKEIVRLLSKSFHQFTIVGAQSYPGSSSYGDLWNTATTTCLEIAPSYSAFSWMKTAYFHLSPLQKHVRKVVGGFGKKSCVSTAVKKPGSTCFTSTKRRKYW